MQTVDMCCCAEGEATGSEKIARRLIWFHHILSTTKRKCIINWGSELELGGYCVPGHPGVLVCEGLFMEAHSIACSPSLHDLFWG